MAIGSAGSGAGAHLLGLSSLTRRLNVASGQSFGTRCYCGLTCIRSDLHRVVNRIVLSSQWRRGWQGTRPPAMRSRCDREAAISAVKPYWLPHPKPSIAAWLHIRVTGATCRPRDFAALTTREKPFKDRNKKRCAEGPHNESVLRENDRGLHGLLRS